MSGVESDGQGCTCPLAQPWLRGVLVAPLAYPLHNGWFSTVASAFWSAGDFVVGE